MSNNINSKSLANLKQFNGKWRSGQTRTIRVPIALAEEVLALTHKLDAGESLDTSDKLVELTLENVELKSKLKKSESLVSSDKTDAATLLNQLKAKNKKSKATLADLEVILELLQNS